MILVWNNAKSFQQHVEDMKAFRQAHDASRNELMLSKNMPIPYDVNVPCKASGGRHVIRTGNKVIIVPIWKVELPAGVQN
jgi:hypothetical protein